MGEVNLKEKIRDIPDFPVKGILFRDVTTLLKDPVDFNEVIDRLAAYYQGKGIELIIAPESRGFIFGAPLAHRLRVGFIPARKPGKLPADKLRVEYALEYGKAALELHRDGIRPGQRVLIVDDLLATGGTVLALKRLVEMSEGIVAGFAFLVELSFLKGRDKLQGYDLFSIVEYND